MPDTQIQNFQLKARNSHLFFYYFFTISFRLSSRARRSEGVVCRRLELFLSTICERSGKRRFTAVRQKGSLGGPVPIHFGHVPMARSTPSGSNKYFGERCRFGSWSDCTNRERGRSPIEYADAVARSGELFESPFERFRLQQFGFEFDAWKQCWYGERLLSVY